MSLIPHCSLHIRNRRLAWAIAFSLLLHAGLGLWRLPSRSAAGESTPFQVHLTPALPRTPALRRPQQPPANTHTRPVPSATSGPPPAVAAAPSATADADRQQSVIDTRAALGAARAIALEPRSERTFGSPKMPVTVEAAVARAAQPDIVTESRGADGEWVSRDRNRRCVARIQRKWFEEGVPMLPLCEVKKG